MIVSESNEAPKLWLFAVCGIFIVLNIDSMWSASVDLAHHYALAFRIAEQWILTSTTDPTLGEMNIYPRGSHVIAALVGRFVDSTFLGIQITTLVAVSSLWLSAILILNSVEKRLAVFSILVFTALFALNAAGPAFDLHGREIVENFFFSQLVGHAILFIGIVVAIALEKTKGVLWAVATLAVLMLINMTVHLLPALEMLGIILGVLFLYVFFPIRTETGVWLRLAIAVPIALTVFVGVVRHPSFLAMRAISENNGGLGLTNIQYPYGVILLCGLVILTSSALLFSWIRGARGNADLAKKYLSIYGGVTAALCLLQFLLTFFGQGSDYAVKKYAFGLSSLLLLQLSLIVGYGFSSVFGANVSSTLNSVIKVKGWILVASLAIVLGLFGPLRKILDVSDVVSTEKKLAILEDTLLPSPQSGKSNVVVGLEGFPSSIDYMFSIAILKTTAKLAIPDVLMKRTISDPTSYTYVVSSATDPNFGAAGCKSLSNNSLSIVASTCVADKREKATDCRSAFDFSTRGTIPRALLKGFSEPEVHGRWTDGNRASFRCVNNGVPLKTVRLSVVPFLFGKLKNQRMSVAINGVASGDYNLAGPRVGDDPIWINLPDNIDTKEYTIEFDVPDAASPTEVGLGLDSRKLGFTFESLRFE